ncbi:MAG: hypothetical protein ACLPXB_07705 [Thiobacillaceae bacterium]
MAGHLFCMYYGGVYRGHGTREIGRQLGTKPVHRPVCSAQSNGMAKSFVKPLKRRYVSPRDRSSAKAMPAPSPATFEHFKEIHRRSALNYTSPRLFGREVERQAQEEDAN